MRHLRRSPLSPDYELKLTAVQTLRSFQFAAMRRRLDPASGVTYPPSF